MRTIKPHLQNLETLRAIDSKYISMHTYIYVYLYRIVPEDKYILFWYSDETGKMYLQVTVHPYQYIARCQNSRRD